MMRLREFFCTSFFLFNAWALGSVVDDGNKAASMSTARDVYDFDKMSSLIKRLDVLEAAAPEILLGFYDPSQKSFSVNPGSGGSKKRVCITSTCYALLAMTLTSGVYESNISYDEMATSTSEMIPIQQVMISLLNSKWRDDDLFQVPLLMYTILRVDESRTLIRSLATDEHFASRIRTLISAVLKAQPQRKLGSRQVHSDYISYQVCKVLASLQSSTVPVTSSVKDYPALKENMDLDDTADKNETKPLGDDPEIGAGGLPMNVLPDDAASEIFWAMLSCSKVSSDELCRQLAYRTAGDSNSFDVVRLAYSLLTYIRSTTILSGSAGRELVPGEGPAPDTKIKPVNKRLVKAALAVYFQEQNFDGMWDKGQPIYMSFKKGKGRNMGGAFVFAVNTLGSLLCALPVENFRSYLGFIERTLTWIETHQTLEMIPDYYNAETGEYYGKPVLGWSSPHLSPEAGPQAWPTAQVLKCVSWMSKVIRKLMHNDVLEEFHGVTFSEKGIQTESWDRLLDSDLGANPCEKGCRTIKSVLEERVVIPFSESIDNPSYGAAYSAILFGPPGTAKTTLCEALAKRMGYDFVVIDTSAFLADGLTNVAARIRYIFRRLMALEKCVILFDEIEEFALDRETPGLSMESRMLTTSMLTAINDLRQKKQSIFFIATNRLRAFDSAITRPGRFDMQLFVGTPNLESRVSMFKEKLSSKITFIDESAYHSAIEAYRDFLVSVWAEDAMFMNYIEGMQFASACADIVTRHGLTDKEMKAILKQQAAVMTVRGSARDEYIASIEQTRF